MALPMNVVSFTGNPPMFYLTTGPKGLHYSPIYSLTGVGKGQSMNPNASAIG
ncbi:Uncharacterized protein APZ42_000567 [Daphnia magna]|uniref:Uncharacterized protein n=1 Tax=Daphnia magna TaxID=35525 RepID=A0A164JJE1_9CRUS|nr:Uncharacterized protein APZ42_000567 [Daphnia magna]